MLDAPLLILQTGTPVPSLRRHGGFDHWIRVAAGLPRGATATVAVEAGESLPPRENFAAAIVTGSAAMVTQRLDWSERCADWLRAAVAAEFPVLGICYGHQLLAHALGGAVGDNPAGREMGTVAVELLSAAREDALFAGLPARFGAQATHLQAVLRAPGSVTVLATTAQDACAAFRIGNAWGLQFHPEFATTHMRGYIAARRDALHAEGRDVDAMLRGVRATPCVRAVLRRFARRALTLQAGGPGPMGSRG